MSLNLSSLTPQEQVATLFIAYFDRAPAPSGLNYWVGELTSGNMTIDEIATSFGVQLETIGLYPELGAPNAATPATNAALVVDIFNNLFGRDPNGTGPDYLDNYWVQQLNAGADIGFIVVQIANGAVGDDLALLENKIEVGLDWSAEALINDIATVTNPMTAVVDGELVILDQEAYDSARSVLDGVTADPATVDAAKAETQEFIDNYGVVTPVDPVDQVFVLTEGTDVLNGGEGDDEFLGNQDTTDTSDVLDGKGGDDTLTVSVQTGAGDVFTAPTLRNIETVEVNGPNLDFGQSITIDLSNASGYEVLRSFQTTTDDFSGGPIFNTMSMYSPALVQFLDIQNANNTNIEIIDTNADHRYTYDTNAMTLFGGDDDTAEILLQEVDGSTITLEMETAVPGTPGGDFRSHIDAVEITSIVRPGQVSATTSNYVWDLNVGPVFNDLGVTGDADLEIDLFLDEGVNNVQASSLAADLDLALIGQGVRVPLPFADPGETQFNVVGDLTVVGAQGDNTIVVHGDTNGSFTFQDGDDLLVVGHSSDTSFDASFFEDVFGNSTVETAGGDDTVILNQTGVQNVDLGDNDDTLIINGNVDDLSTYLWNDGVSMVQAGDGDDNVTLNGIVPADVNNGLQNVPSDPVDLDNDYMVDLGDGDDTLEVNGGGDLNVAGGGGEDDITVNGNGDQIIDSGDDDDTVAINGTGVHNVTLGQGNDDLSIIGSRLPDNNIDNTIEDRQTTINGNDGDDTIFVDGDHYLLASLGTGADSIELNADELTVDDIIYGNAAGEEDTEQDTLILNNNNGNVQDGFVGRSETSSVSGIDVFDLRDTNITLELSSDNFDTAFDGDILVRTTEALSLDIPQRDPDFGPQLSQGMTRGEYEAWAEFWFGGDGVSTNEAVNAGNNWVLNTANAGVTSVNFFDADASSDASIHTPGVPGGYTGDSFPFTGTDTVDFQGVVDGKMVVDITNIPMSVGSGRNFTFEGGTIRDVIVADDASISSRLILDFDASRGTLHSAEDTLQVIDGAEITAADLRNVSGLEIIELMSAENDSQTWVIELNDRVINQTTSNAPLIIRVDPDVPAGSEVYIDLDPSIWSGTATKDVIIETVANAQIFIDRNDGNGPQLVTQPDYGVTDYNQGPLGTIIVNPRLVFTQNADNLEGTIGNDTFIFDSISKLSAADNANGFDGTDTIIADGVTVANQGQDLFDQLGNPGLTSIERFVFDTGQNVLMTRLDGQNGPLDNMLNTLVTGSGNDNLLEMEAIGGNLDQGYFLGGGDDNFESMDQGPFLAIFDDGSRDDTYFVDGGLGDDTATMEESDNLFGTDIETINLLDGADAGDGSAGGLRTAQGVDGDTMTVNGSIDPNSSDDSDENYVDLDSEIRKASDGTLATVLLYDIEDLDDFGGDNIMIMDNDRNGPDGDADVNIHAGDDVFTATNMNNLELDAGAGTKTVTVGVGADPLNPDSSVNNFDYTGGTGTGGSFTGFNSDGGIDNIVAVIDDDADIFTGDLDDNVNVTSTQSGTVDIDGGNGDDIITARSDSGTVIVAGGNGNDTININSLGGVSFVDSGLGLDTINLVVDLNGGADTIQFGDINYDGLQQVVTGTTTQNFVQNGVNSSAHTGSANDGVDIINGFNMEFIGAGAEDVLDVSSFLQNTANPTPALATAADIRYGDYRDGDFEAVQSAGNTAEIAVIAVNQGFELDATLHLKSTGVAGDGIAVGDNSGGDTLGRVVVAAWDSDGDGGFDMADVYFVQDLDQNFGVAFAVDKVATITFATEIGAIDSIDGINFGI